MRKRLALLTAVALTAAMFIGFTAVSQAQDVCTVDGPTAGDSDLTGGTLISLSVACEDSTPVSVVVTVSADGTVLFQNSDEVTVGGDSTYDKTLHLPPPPFEDVKICVEVNGEEHCVPPGSL